jgi:hypothetical protein
MLYFAARLISVIFCNNLYCSFIRFSLQFLPTFSKINIMIFVFACNHIALMYQEQAMCNQVQVPTYYKTTQ